MIKGKRTKNDLLSEMGIYRYPFEISNYNHNLFNIEEIYEFIRNIEKSRFLKPNFIFKFESSCYIIKVSEYRYIIITTRNICFIFANRYCSIKTYNELKDLNEDLYGCIRQILAICNNYINIFDNN